MSCALSLEHYAELLEAARVGGYRFVGFDGRPGPGELILFVVPADGTQFDDALRAKVVAALRAALSPRHVPDLVAAVPAIPRTLTSKKLELPVKRILLGAQASEVASRDALADPNALDAFVEFAARRALAKN